ncbi:hypothetical protein [Devosia aurantiaca]|nr:hypothetical protein [Devosia aurantiaca]
MRFKAENTARVEVLAGAASLGGAIGGVTGVAASIGFAMAQNVIDSNVSAYLLNVTKAKTTGGLLIVEAVSSGTIKAEAYAASAAVGVGMGGGGIAVAGGGAAATNKVSSDTVANVTGGRLESTGAITVKASSASTIDAKIAAVALAVGADLSAGVGIAIGSSVAVNQIGTVGDRNKVEATLENVSVDAGGTLTVDALSNNQITATILAAAAALSGGTVGVSVGGAGAGGRNEIAVATRARINGDGTGIVAGGLAVSAQDTSKIKALAAAGSVAASFGAAGASVALGIGAADNVVRNQITAEIVAADTLIDVGSAGVSLTARDNTEIEAVASAASLAVAFSTVAVAGSGAAAKNSIDNDVLAQISSSKLDSVGNVMVTAESIGSIKAKIAAAAAAAVIVPGAGVGVAIGVAVAVNEIGDWTDAGETGNDPKFAPVQGVNGGSSLKAVILNSQLDVDGDVSLSGRSAQTIKAEVVSAAAALAGSDLAVGVAGAGTYAENRIAMQTEASISGTSNNRATISASDISISANDSSDIDALVGSVALAAAVGSTAGVSVAGSVAVAKNVIDNDVSAFALYANLEAELIPTHDPVYTRGGDGSIVHTNKPSVNAATPGKITISARQGATIDAQSASAALGVAAASFGASIGAGGAIALNAILGSTNAFANGSSLRAGDDILVQATNIMTIEAEVAALAGSVSIGGVAVSASLGAGVAQNFIGYTLGSGNPQQRVQVLSYLNDTTVDTYGNPMLSPRRVPT